MPSHNARAHVVTLHLVMPWDATRYWRNANPGIVYSTVLGYVLVQQLQAHVS